MKKIISWIVAMMVSVVVVGCAHHGVSPSAVNAVQISETMGAAHMNMKEAILKCTVAPSDPASEVGRTSLISETAMIFQSLIEAEELALSVYQLKAQQAAALNANVEQIAQAQTANSRANARTVAAWMTPIYVGTGAFANVATGRYLWDLNHTSRRVAEIDAESPDELTIISSTIAEGAVSNNSSANALVEEGAIRNNIEGSTIEPGAVSSSSIVEKGAILNNVEGSTIEPGAVSSSSIVEKGAIRNNVEGSTIESGAIRNSFRRTVIGIRGLLTP